MSHAICVTTLRFSVPRPNINDSTGNCCRPLRELPSSTEQVNQLVLNGQWKQSRFSPLKRVIRISSGRKSHIPRPGSESYRNISKTLQYARDMRMVKRSSGQLDSSSRHSSKLAKFSLPSSSSRTYALVCVIAKHKLPLNCEKQILSYIEILEDGATIYIGSYSRCSSLG